MRHNFLFTSLIVGVLITLSTEALSLFHAINSLWITLLWACILVAVIFQFRKSLFSFPKFPSLETFEWIMLAGIGLFLLILGIIAFFAPPNTWDSMTYHMPRVMHWIQNRTVDYYPTYDERQIWKSTFAEYAILHLQMLCHSDRCANFVQWFCYIGNIIGVTLITKTLNGDRFTQIFSAVIAATIPMSILEASGTQNDLVASFWMVAFTYFILAWHKVPNLKNALCIAASLSLSLATKEINFIYALPILLMFLVLGVKDHPRKILLPLFWIVVLVLLINGPHWLRNYQLYENPLSTSSTTESFILEDHHPMTLLSNIILNIGNHLKTPWEELNTVFQNLIALIHQWMGTSIETSKANPNNFHYVQSPLHEDNAGNFLHALLIIISFGLCLFIRRLRSPMMLTFCLSVACLFLCFIWFMKWSIFHNRVQLPIFILFSPIIAITLSEIFKRNVSFAIALILLTSALPWLISNVSRPLIGKNNIFVTPRNQQYFANLKSAAASYADVALEIQNYQCHNVGYGLGDDRFEYPLWIILKKNNWKDLRIEHMLGNTPSFAKLSYPLGNFTPCAILQQGLAKETSFMHNNEYYILTLHRPFLNVYINVKWGMMMQGRQQ